MGGATIERPDAMALSPHKRRAGKEGVSPQSAQERQASKEAYANKELEMLGLAGSTTSAAFVDDTCTTTATGAEENRSPQTDSQMGVALPTSETETEGETEGTKEEQEDEHVSSDESLEPDERVLPRKGNSPIDDSVRFMVHADDHNLNTGTHVTPQPVGDLGFELTEHELLEQIIDGEDQLNEQLNNEGTYEDSSVCRETEGLEGADGKDGEEREETEEERELERKKQMVRGRLLSTPCHRLQAPEPSAEFIASLNKLAMAKDSSCADCRIVHYTGGPQQPEPPTMQHEPELGLFLTAHFGERAEWTVSSCRVLLNITEASGTSQMFVFDSGRKMWRTTEAEDWSDLSRTGFPVSADQTELPLQVTATHVELGGKHFQSCCCVVDPNGQASSWSPWSAALFIPPLRRTTHLFPCGGEGDVQHSGGSWDAWKDGEECEGAEEEASL